ncbi:MAG: hypothetical protein ACXWQ5_00230 [Ktedonobacterales bacterium]
MPLRSANDPVDALGVLSAVATVIVPNTRFAQNNGTVYTNNWSVLNSANATYPAIVLEGGEQVSRRSAWRTWQSSLIVHIQYVDMWETQDNTLDAIWAALDLDLHRIKANLEDNSTLTTGGVAHALNLSDFWMSPYIGNREDRTGVIIVKRNMKFTAHMPLYVSAL